jgi:hypothetical protein
MLKADYIIVVQRAVYVYFTFEFLLGSLLGQSGFSDHFTSLKLVAN